MMSGVGAITESDATYAITAGAVIFGFNDNICEYCNAKYKNI